MAQSIKSCDYPGEIASRIFEMLNPDVKYTRIKNGLKVIITDTDPNQLIYPEGWYYAKGTFRNKHQSTSGMYDEIYMVTSKGESWSKIAKYCTLSA